MMIALVDWLKVLGPYIAGGLGAAALVWLARLLVPGLFKRGITAKTEQVEADAEIRRAQIEGERAKAEGEWKKVADQTAALAMELVKAAKEEYGGLKEQQKANVKELAALRITVTQQALDNTKLSTQIADLTLQLLDNEKKAEALRGQLHDAKRQHTECLEDKEKQAAEIEDLRFRLTQLEAAR